MSYIILVPLLPLLAAIIVVIGTRDSQVWRAKIAAYPIGAACLGAIGTLWLVATQGPLTIRFYDPSSLYRFRALPPPFAGRNLTSRSGLVYRGQVKHATQRSCARHDADERQADAL